MPGKIEYIISEDDEKMYLEIESFINFLRDPANEKAGDDYYNEAILAICDFLSRKQQELLADRILENEVAEVKDKDRLN